MTGFYRILLMARVAWHRWRAERDFDAGTIHALRANELEAEAASLKTWGRS